MYLRWLNTSQKLNKYINELNGEVPVNEQFVTYVYKQQYLFVHLITSHNNEMFIMKACWITYYSYVL
jgi:hypothetical protein